MATLRLFPGIAAATISAFFMPPIRGVVLETFGAGNAPQRADLMQALKEACDRGVVVVAITQCSKGSVSDAYETGRTLLQAGVVSGSDMTPEVCAILFIDFASFLTEDFMPLIKQCALTKLSYLLSKPELSVEEVRELITTPLRGELTRPVRSAPSQPITIDKSFDSIQGVISEFVRLSQPPSQGPHITISSDTLDASSKDATAPWSWTAAEAASTEAILIPFLVHLAAAKDDVPSLRFCIDSTEGSASKEMSSEQHQSANIMGGVVNCLDPATGKTPLHVASMNGSTRAADLLLRSGALVHLRDILGHTALYYVRQKRTILIFINIDSHISSRLLDKVMSKLLMH